MTPPLTLNLRDWFAKNRLSASHLQEPVEAINALLMAAAAEQPDGTSPIHFEQWPGVISATGPNREADFADERYWVQKGFIKGAAPNAQVTVQAEVAQSQSSSTTPSGVGPDQNASNIFAVTNLPEAKAHTHALAAGSMVWVWAWWDAGLTSVPGALASQPDNQKHYLMCVGGSGSLPTGQYQYMLYGNVAQNQTGFMFARAHPVI